MTLGKWLGPLLAVIVCGCSQATYDRTVIDEVARGELPVSIDTRLISLRVGTAVTARVRTLNTDGNLMIGSVRAEDPTILSVEPAVGDDMYAFLGLQRGRTVVVVLADGSPVERIEAEVVDQ